MNYDVHVSTKAQFAKELKTLTNSMKNLASIYVKESLGAVRN